MNELGAMLRGFNDGTMDADWRKTIDRVRAYIGDGSDRGFKATYLLGLILGSSLSGQMKMEDAVKMALVMVELSPADREIVKQ